jgi:hypothetical protein
VGAQSDIIKNEFLTWIKPQGATIAESGTILIADYLVKSDVRVSLGFSNNSDTLYYNEYWKENDR